MSQDPNVHAPIPGLFAFEQDGRYPLRRIPMIVRWRLDGCGMRIGLEAWVRLSREQREQLVRLDANEFGCALGAMLAKHDEPFETVAPIDPAAPQPMPATLAEEMQGLGLTPATLVQWQALSPLQQFTLTKLSRPGHRNGNLPAALAEFGFSQAPCTSTNSSPR